MQSTEECHTFELQSKHKLAESFYDDAGGTESIWDIKARAQKNAEEQENERSQRRAAGETIRDERMLSEDSKNTITSNVVDLGGDHSNPFGNAKGWKKSRLRGKKQASLAQSIHLHCKHLLNYVACHVMHVGSTFI
eukprot:SAG31_NODE_9775_length_1229_cov_1.273451_1_plen_136_part_00